MESNPDSPKKLKGFTFAVVSGILACLAGTFGKFAMTQSETTWHCENVCISYFRFNGNEADTFCANTVSYFRGLAFLLMVLLNVVMLTTFLKALRYCHTSLEATVTNTAANFFASALVGRLLFNENITLLSWLGTLLIIFGFGLMNFSSKGGTLKSLLGRHRKRKLR